MNSRLNRLHPYPFEKLRDLLADVRPAAHKSPIPLSIGEPGHAAPDFVRAAINESLARLSSYPLTRGDAELRATIATWLERRYRLSRRPDAETEILPTSGSREALFSFIQAVVDTDNSSSQPVVVMPNPFYQIYEGATLLAGAEPAYLNSLAENAFQPDLDELDEATWKRVQLLVLCSPDNPTGAVLTSEVLSRALELAEKFDFIVALDECYSEIYFDETKPPIGLLQHADADGNGDFARCVIFQSLSKRSNLPGLRSGFVAGDRDILANYFRYRTYHGCTLSPVVQAASVAAWSDEDHVRDNRDTYRQKFDHAVALLADVLEVQRPDAGFYLWPRTPGDDQTFAAGLVAAENVKVLPGSFLSRPARGIDPGTGRVRMALVPDLETTRQALERIAAYTATL